MRRIVHTTFSILKIWTIPFVIALFSNPYQLLAQCANSIPATTLDNATTDPFIYTGLANGMNMTIENTTDNIVNITANSGYRLGGSTAANRIYKITFLKPVSCATLYFQEMDNSATSERLTAFSSNDSLATYTFTNLSSGVSSNIWDNATRTITAGAGSTGASSASKLQFSANVAFTEIYFQYNKTSVSNPGGVLLTQVDFTESTISPTSPCKCADAPNCGLNQYANEATAFTAYDAQSGTSYNLRPDNLLHSITGHAYDLCVDYTTGPIETRLAVRQLVTFTNSCTGFVRTYNIRLKDCATTTATFVAANLTGGTRNFQFYNVQPNTTYRLCATVTLTSPCHAKVTSEFQPEYTTSTWYAYNASPAAAAFAFNCGTASISGTFTANGVSGQTGTMTVPITGATAGSAIFSVSGTGFSGSLGTILTAGQTSVVIPITYNGTGTSGSRTLTVTSSQGTGTCSKSVTVLGCSVGTISTTETSCTPNDGKILTGANVTLTANSGTAYLWSTGETTASIVVTPSVSTAYFVTVSNVGGCSIANKSITVDIDSDNDCILNGDDIDDDNDGVIDNMEITCSSGGVVEWTHNDSGGTSIAGSISTAAAGSIQTVTPSVIGAGFTTVSSSYEYVLGGANQTTFAAAKADNDYVEYGFTVKTGVAVKLELLQHGLVPAAWGGTAYGGYSITAEISNDNFVTATVLYQDGFITIPASSYIVSYQDISDYILQAGQGYKIRFYLYNETNASAQQVAFDDVQLIFSGPCNLDSDGDNIVNSLDLDSDNDNCSDAFEAGATTDITTNYQFTGVVGNNGLIDTKETAVDSGIINYSATYNFATNAAIKACCSVASIVAPTLLKRD
jgi:hypothetical protein